MAHNLQQEKGRVEICIGDERIAGLAQEVIENLPNADLQIVKGRVSTIQGSENRPEGGWGAAQTVIGTDIPAQEERTEIVLYFPSLRGLSPDLVKATIAHELAHVVVAYHYGHGDPYDKHDQHLREEWADELAQDWGFDVSPARALLERVK